MRFKIIGLVNKMKQKLIRDVTNSLSVVKIELTQ